MGYVWIIASRYLRSKRRLNFITLVSLLAIGGVFVGTAALTIVLSVMNGFEDQVQRRIAGTNAHIAVLSADDRPMPVNPDLVAAIRKAIRRRRRGSPTSSRISRRRMMRSPAGTSRESRWDASWLPGSAWRPAT
jgi:ABC-type lipoprotein release transport system permease subunit